ncbi:MAG: N-6 DNA methylase [Solirubrobacterales bacterium]
MEAAPASDANRQKELGAFYTPPAMAAKLVDWGVRSPTDRVLDPSFGGLVFLDAARRRLQALGAKDPAISAQLFGVDVDDGAYAATAQREGLVLPPGSLVHGDFFAVSPGEEIPLCEAVVGNPPYIRYQGFNGSAARAHELAQAAGVPLTRLASSWAPFLIHATAFVTPGGRLAQVLPAELLHAQYAARVLEHLRTSFREVVVAVFDELVFPGALEEVVLLIADGRGNHAAGDVKVVSATDLAGLDLTGLASNQANRRGMRGSSSRSKLLGQLLPEPARQIYERLSAHNDVHRLGTLASVDIGIVTGGNTFFMLTAEEASELAPALVRPAIAKAAQVAGARLSHDDHDQLLARGQRGFLFVADAETDQEALDTAMSYLERGQRSGIAQRYKCRVRNPWWALPLPKAGVPDLFLTYCANRHPRLALNEAEVLQTNTIHGVTLDNRKLAPGLAAGFYNSLTLLSTELEGRSYGGGVLKLEPTEAESLLLPPIPSKLGSLLGRVDTLVRSGNLDNLLDLVDAIVLHGALGLTLDEIGWLRAGATRLRNRRLSRGRPIRPDAAA